MEKKAREEADARTEAEARGRQEAEARAEVEARGRQEAERLGREKDVLISRLLAAQSGHEGQREQVASGTRASGGAFLPLEGLREEEKGSLKRAHEKGSLERLVSEEGLRNENVDDGEMPPGGSSTKKKR